MKGKMGSNEKKQVWRKYHGSSLCHVECLYTIQTAIPSKQLNVTDLKLRKVDKLKRFGSHQPMQAFESSIAWEVREKKSGRGLPKSEWAEHQYLMGLLEKWISKQDIRKQPSNEWPGRYGGNLIKWCKLKGKRRCQEWKSAQYLEHIQLVTSPEFILLFLLTKPFLSEQQESGKQINRLYFPGFLVVHIRSFWPVINR